ncbi:MT-A70 family methyltransferase [Methylosinus sp. Sm6]|uniref:MT-A70 family methyltransferase n=1 Tax=Methylosinus sp. Sm6 TaxID=2866948 RepID=UPI00351D1BEF
MTALALYDVAGAALAELARIDEVKKIRDKALALEAYARQAKDGELIGHAIEVRKRAERRAGELLIVMERAGEREARGGDRKSKCRDGILKLADLGVSAKESMRWQELARLDGDDFERRVVAAAREAERLLVATREERQTAKKEARERREAELGAKQRALPDRRYGVIYADPEWRFEAWSRETGMDRAPDNHYPTSDLATILARDVASIAADDCVLFCWATAPMLPQGLATLAAWGFGYKSHCVWIKDRIGTGYWWRGKHELLLLGVRGDVPAPAMGLQFPSSIEAPVGEHSAKPDVFAEMIEFYFPSLPKIELNRRGPPRTGWDAWGNEAEAEGAP